MNDKKLKKYFLPYQIEDILDESRLSAWEKSIRIGATYAKSFRAVRRRMLGNGDYLHTSVSMPAALEFVQNCTSWHKIIGAVALSIGEIEWDKSVEEKAYQIKYDNGFRIIAFSSNPNAIRSFGGEVGIDEIAFHRDPKAMRQAAGGRAMWGYPVSIWSSHNGWESDWNQFLLEQKARGAASPWKIKTTTLLDAIDQGLVEKINETRGTTFTRAGFVQETIELVGGQEAFDEECMCQPRKAGDAAVKWQFIDAAKEDYEILRLSVVGDDAVDTEAVAGQVLMELRKAEASAVGFDVARTGHLSALWINRKEANRWRLVALITMQKRKFGLQRQIAADILRRVPAMVGCGDATGLGMQICEELQSEFGLSRFAGLNFSALKPDIGTKLIHAYEDSTQIIPRGERYAEISADVAGIRQAPTASGRIQFYETRNPHNKESHCDLAWANGMAIFATTENVPQGVW